MMKTVLCHSVHKCHNVHKCRVLAKLVTSLFGTLYRKMSKGALNGLIGQY